MGSLEPTAAPLSGLVRLPFRAARLSGCGSALIRYPLRSSFVVSSAFAGWSLTDIVAASVTVAPLGRETVDSFVTEVSQDTWILFPWDTEPQFIEPLARRTGL